MVAAPMGTATVPISRRPRDWFFVAVLSLFTATSLFSDAPHALGVTSGAFGDANRFYADAAGDRYFASNPMPLRVRLYFTAFVCAPVTAYLAYAFLRGVARARPVALLYAGTLSVSVLEFFAWEWSSGTPPTHLGAFFGFNGPYLVVPLLLIARMWKPRPFGDEPG